MGISNTLRPQCQVTSKLEIISLSGQNKDVVTADNSVKLITSFQLGAVLGGWNPPSKNSLKTVFGLILKCLKINAQKLKPQKRSIFLDLG